MAQQLPSLGKLELQVLRLIWQHEPCTEKHISDLILADRPVRRTTVLKTIQRLEEKGLLKRVPETRPVQFRAVVKEQRALPQLVGRFVEGVLGGSAEPLVSYLADSKRLSQKDLKTLREIARKLEDAEK